MIAGASASVAISQGSRVKTTIVGQHELPVKKILVNSPLPPEALLPMPVGNLDLAARKVASSRNPFQKPSGLQAANLAILNRQIQFSGIAKSVDSVVAMIKTTEGQEAYEVGDTLGNGFVVTSISSIDVTVDISDGLRNYRLSLKEIKD